MVLLLYGGYLKRNPNYVVYDTCHGTSRDGLRFAEKFYHKKILPYGRIKCGLFYDFLNKLVWSIFGIDTESY